MLSYDNPILDTLYDASGIHFRAFIRDNFDNNASYDTPWRMRGQ